MNENTANSFDGLCTIIKKLVAEKSQKERLNLGLDALNIIGDLVSNVIAQTTPRPEGQKNES